MAAAGSGRNAHVPFSFFQNFGGSTIESGSGGAGTGARGGDIGSHNTTNIYLNEQNDDKAIDMLAQHIASGAFHNSAERYDPPKCHPHTREAVIKEILHWIESDSYAHPLLWMYGPAGTGKSSIAQTIAEMLEKEGKVAASFFFSRTVENRNENTRLIATIAYQLTLVIPEIRHPMAKAIQNDPAVFSRSLKAQIDALVLRPLAGVSRTAAVGKRSKRLNYTYPGLVIVDGLDECGTPDSQRHVLETLFHAVQQSSHSLFCLIASRPEYEIRNFFNKQKVHGVARPLVLDDKYRPNEDIEIYLRATFDDIKKSHPSGLSLDPNWPPESDVQKLVHKASEQFVYVSTVMKFIADVRNSPFTRLQIALQLTPPKEDLPFAGLDTLYTHILGSVHDIERVKEIFAFLIMNGAPFNTHFNAELSTVNAFLHIEKGELQILLIDLHSVIHVPQVDEASESIRLYHASLGDFFLDRSRSGQFFIDAREEQAKMARNCVRVISDIINDDLRWYERDTFLMSCNGLLPICTRYCQDPDESFDPNLWSLPHSCLIKDLHDDLESFDLAAFLNLPFGKHRDILPEVLLETVPLVCCALLLWIQFHSEEADLYRHYEDQLYRFFVGRFKLYPAPAVFHVLTVSTILSAEKISEFFYLLDLGTVVPTYSLPDHERFSFTHLWDKVAGFVTDRNRAGIYHIDSSKHKELVKFCVGVLNVPQFHDRNAKMPDWPSWLNDTNLLVCQCEELCLDLISAAISRIPLDHEFAEFLHQNPIPDESKYNVEESRQLALLAIRTYIKCCDKQSQPSRDWTLSWFKN